MSNERLERIKERVNYHSHLDDDIEWLIKQAERVQELEELIAAYHTELSIKDNANKRIKKKNKRYREALEFYADEENYEFETIVSDCDIEVVSKVLDDYGQKARNALERDK